MSEILGALFAVLVGFMLIPKLATFQQVSNNASTAAITAQQQKQFAVAATAYIQQNSTAIQAIASSTTPAIVTVAMLQAPAVNLLPASFSAQNPYGQTWQLQVLEPTAGNLQALAMSIGGNAVPDLQANKIAAIMGAAGGIIPLNDSGIYPGGAANAYGTASGWTVSTTGYSSVAGGHPAALLTFNNSQLTSNYLYRNAVPGQPQLNTMSTPLIMASVQTVGNACTTTGAMAQNGTGAIISCQAGLWAIQGSGGVACAPTSADLNTLETDQRCWNLAGNANSPAGGDWIFLEVYRHVNTGNYYVNQRAVGMTGAAVGRSWSRSQLSATVNSGWGAWQQLADGQVIIGAGTINAAGAITAGTLSSAGTITATGTITAANIVVPTGNNLTVGGSSYYGDPTNSAIRQNGSLYIQHYDGSPAAISAVSSINSTGDHSTTGTLFTNRDYWSMISRNGAGQDNAQQTSANGSAYLNDAYFRSVGMWASQIANTANAANSRAMTPGPQGGTGPQGPAGPSVSGSLCGSYNNYEGITAYCQGYNVVGGCPGGYNIVRTSSASGGSNGWSSYSCAKS